MALLNTRNRANAVNTTFHVYSRGLDRQPIFVDDHDRREFLQCFRRYLTPSQSADRRGRPYRKMSSAVDVLAVCLMLNHFHFVIHQFHAKAITELLDAALTGYVKYFNSRHGRAGPLFAKEFRTAPKHSPFEIQSAISYVHLNHPDGPGFKFSSHSAYVGNVEQPDWLNIDAGLAVFGGQRRYERFIASRQRARS